MNQVTYTSQRQRIAELERQIADATRFLANESLVKENDRLRSKLTTHPSCTWTVDPDDGSYDTGCDNKYLFIAGNIEHNGARFCCYCGGKIVAQESENQS